MTNQIIPFFGHAVFLVPFPPSPSPRPEDGSNHEKIKREREKKKENCLGFRFSFSIRYIERVSGFCQGPPPQTLCCQTQYTTQLSFLGLDSPWPSTIGSTLVQVHTYTLPTQTSDLPGGFLSRAVIQKSGQNAPGAAADWLRTPAAMDDVMRLDVGAHTFVCCCVRIEWHSSFICY